MTEDKARSERHDKPGIDISTWPIEKEMRNLVEKGLHLDQDAVYKHLSTSLPFEEIIYKMKGDFDDAIAEEMISTTKDKLGENFVRLLIEPSLSTRFDEFITFAHDLLKESNLSPWEVRNKFRDSLGKKTVYRVTKLHPEDLQTRMSDGFVANFYKKMPAEKILHNTSGLESMQSELTNLQGRIDVHAGAHALPQGSLFISVSEYPDMAAYAGTIQHEELSHLQSSGYKLYLVPIEIDEFYLVRYGKYLEKVIRGDGFWTDGKTKIPYQDTGIEAFVEFSIPAKFINTEGVKELDWDKIPQFHYVPKPD